MRSAYSTSSSSRWIMLCTSRLFDRCLLSTYGVSSASTCAAISGSGPASRAATITLMHAARVSQAVMCIADTIVGGIAARQ